MLGPAQLAVVIGEAVGILGDGLGGGKGHLGEGGEL